MLSRRLIKKLTGGMRSGGGLNRLADFSSSGSPSLSAPEGLGSGERPGALTPGLLQAARAPQSLGVGVGSQQGTGYKIPASAISQLCELGVVT